MDSRICNRCKIEKPIAEFYPKKDKPGQYIVWCKQCLREHGKIYHDSERGKKRDAEYRKSDARKESLMRYNVSEKRKAVTQRYYETGKPLEHQERRKESDPDHKKKKWARAQARTALLSGKFIEKPCEYAHLENCHGRAEMHHDDYDKPLDVRWLCSRHHRFVDNKTLA